MNVIPFRIEPLQELHFEQLHCLFDAICKERRFLAFTEAGPKEQTSEYYRKIVRGGYAHFVAIRDQCLVGWCDALPLPGQMRSHVGVLGMGVAAEERGKGVGRALIQAAIGKAADQGLSRIELTVHSENRVAQELYRSMGFVHEGTQREGWCLDGRCFDVYSMAKIQLKSSVTVD
jgi:ribosomal protein S18 acetylase RimI-like enzyme